MVNDPTTDALKPPHFLQVKHHPVVRATASAKQQQCRQQGERPGLDSLPGGESGGCAPCPPPAGGVRAVGDAVRYKRPGPDTSWALGVVVAAEERHVLVRSAHSGREEWIARVHADGSPAVDMCVGIYTVTLPLEDCMGVVELNAASWSCVDGVPSFRKPNFCTYRGPLPPPMLEDNVIFNSSPRGWRPERLPAGTATDGAPAGGVTSGTHQWREWRSQRTPIRWPYAPGAFDGAYLTAAGAASKGIVDPRPRVAYPERVLPDRPGRHGPEWCDQTVPTVRLVPFSDPEEWVAVDQPRAKWHVEPLPDPDLVWSSNGAQWALFGGWRSATPLEHRQYYGESTYSGSARPRKSKYHRYAEAYEFAEHRIKTDKFVEVLLAPTVVRAIAAGAADRAPWGSAWAAQAAQWSPQMVERDRKTLRFARFCGFAISTAFLNGPALGATPEGARTSPAAGAAPVTA